MEYMEVAKELGKIQYIDRVIIEHQHPVWTGKKYDRLMEYNESKKFWRIDKATYDRRKSEGFRNYFMGEDMLIE